MQLLHSFSGHRQSAFYIENREKNGHKKRKVRTHGMAVLLVFGMSRIYLVIWR